MRIPPPPRASSVRRHRSALVAIAIAAAIVAAGLSARWTRAEQLRDEAQNESVRAVSIVLPTPVKAATLELPARIEAWSRAPIYARASGYLKAWNVDIGGAVKAGQVLAELETPDLDQALQQARAELARARSDAKLAESTARRWQSLLASDSVSRQEVEERVADHAAKRAAVEALQANVERSQALQGYRTLTAPFDGVVTARNTDVGALVNVGVETGRELFVVSDVRRLRVYVSVPQRQVAAIVVGAKAQLRVPERPDQTYQATVQSLSQAIDSRTGSMRVQLSVENPNGELLPGGYALVRFERSSDNGAAGIGLPPAALIVNRNGVQVATLDAENRARLKPVTIIRDLGNMVELAGGLSPEERVINSPPDGIGDGDQVRLATKQQGPVQ
ncbi:efflux RND transporter periplasmic adaptor subunit [Achromobacter piechaudii]|uniref:Multidrug resistance protein MdtA n=1 Tax=Achromobacter piechaudii TaxID=72556 RepID=A0A6S7CXJ1_9BURK|nr:efflux RND transporter periplasmic adaptor subunit [Achromobacter piechaudii]CAB3868491.1 Multidrug resistance protein MdtA [Achromobacter piechaudii]